MKQLQSLKNVLSFSAKEFSFVFFGYVLMFLAVQYVIYPVQEIIVPESTMFAALIFLPHGVRVVSIWLLRERAIIPLFLASLVIYRSFYWHAEPFYLNYFLLAIFVCIDLSIQTLTNYTKLPLNSRINMR